MKHNLAHNVVMLHDYTEKQGVAVDHAGYNNKGTIIGAQFVRSPWGYCLDFNGNNHRVNVPYNANLNIGDNFGFRIWFDTTTSDQERYIICGSSQDYYVTVTSTGKIKVYVITATGYSAAWGSLTSSASVNDGKLHVADIYIRGTVLEIYIDGRRDATGTIAAAKVRDTTNQLSIGNHWSVNYSGGSGDVSMDSGDYKARWSNNVVLANKLSRTNETFITKGVVVGDKVSNRSDNTYATVTNVDSETVLSISADIFTVLNKQYTVGLSYDDCQLTGTYTGTSTRIYKFEIDYEGTDPSTDPDTFKWSDNNGASWTTGVAITGGWQSLSNGLSVKFDNKTGHVVGASWTNTVKTYNFIGQIALVDVNHAGARLYENLKEWRDNFRSFN